MYNVWTGSKVRLRALEPDDWEIFYTEDQDSEMARLRSWVRPPSTKEEYRKWAEERSQRGSEGDVFYLVIETLDGQIAGSISTHGIDRKNGTFKYGLGLFRSFWGKGYGSEALLLLLRFFFLELRYQKAGADVFSFNEASLAFHRKFGFVEEGRRRRVFFTNGAYHDDVIFGMTVEEFLERHGK